MEELRLDGRDMKPRPCTTCEDIIAETAAGRGDDSEIVTWEEFVLSLDITEESPTIEPEVNLGNP